MPISFNRFFVMLAFCFTLATDLRAETWLAAPSNGQWNNVNNWDLGTWPNGSSASATFGSSSTTAVTLVASATVGNILFNGGSQFLISTNGSTLDIQGTGVNNTSGSAQTIWNNGGDLFFRNNAQAVSAVLINDSSSIMTFYDTASSGMALIQNSGVLTFQDNASAAGATINTLSGGQVAFTGNASGGQARVSLASGSFLSMDYSTAGAVTIGSIDGAGNIFTGSNNLTLGINSLSTTLSGVISDVGFGGGSLTKTGLGTLTLTGTNTYSGGTSILSGGVFLAGGSLGTGPVVNGGTLTYALNSSAVSHVTNNGTLIFQDTATAGSALLTNNSTLDFNNSSSAVSAFVNNFGTLDFNNTSTAANGFIINSGLMNFNDASTAANAAISNAGAIYFQGDSATTIASAGSAIIINSNLVQFGNNSTAGDSQIRVQGASALNFTGTAQGGTAQIYISNGGTLDIAGQSTGGITVSYVQSQANGLIQLGSNYLSMTGVGNINDDYGTFSGTGGLVFLGGLSKLWASNTYSGATSILNGASLAAGSSTALGLGSTANVYNAGYFYMFGPLGLSIGGNYTQTGTGTLRLTLDGTGVGQFDSLAVAGSASLAGTLVIQGSYAPILGSEYTVLTSTGPILGYFSQVNVNGGLARFLPYYKPNELDLYYIHLSFASLGNSSNQKSVGAALDASVYDPAQQNLMLSLGTASASALPAAYDQISPAGLTPLFQMGYGLAQERFSFVEQRLGSLWAMIDASPREQARANGQRMFASTLDLAQENSMGAGFNFEHWGGFTQGLGSFGTVTGDGNGPGYQFFTGGMAVGVDDRMAKDLVGGFLAGYSQSGTSQAADSVQVSGGQFGVYGGWRSGDLRLEGLLDGGINNYNTTRASYGGPATGTTRGIQYGMQLGGELDWKAGGLNWGPLATGRFTHVQLDGFAESGAAALTFPSQGQEELASELGLQARMGGTAFGGNLKVSWAHVYQGNLDQMTAALGASSNTFVVDGPVLGTDGFLVAVGVQFGLGKGLAAQVGYQGVLGMTNFDSQNFSGGVSLDL